MTNKKRFFLSTLRTFLAGFIGTLTIFLGSINSIENLTTQTLIAALFAAVIAGINLVLKSLQEKLQGRI